MQLKDIDILIIPDIAAPCAKQAGEDIWYKRWQKNIKNAHIFEQQSFDAQIPPNNQHDQANWLMLQKATLLRQITQLTKPVLIIAHGLGALLASELYPSQTASKEPERANSAGRANNSNIIGGFFVSPHFYPALNSKSQPFSYKKERLSYPSVIIASLNSPYYDISQITNLGQAWGSLIIESKEGGHFTSAEGYGPWPEGLLVFSQFLAKL